MNYKITVNGISYDVEVQPMGTSSGAQVAPAQAPDAAQAVSSAPSGAAGSVRVEAQVAGKIFKVVAAAGDVVSAGDPIVILEAMKMEIPVVAPSDGTVASIEVREGDPVEVGYLIATMD